MHTDKSYDLTKIIKFFKIMHNTQSLYCVYVVDILTQTKVENSIKKQMMLYVLLKK